MSEFITELDFSLLYFIQEYIRTDFLDAVSKALSIGFEAGIGWFLISFILIAFRKTRTAGVMLICAMGLAFLVGEIALKNIICRPRPCHVDTSVLLAVKAPTSYSFPSGHTGSSFAAATALFICNKKLGVLALVLALAVGLSRAYLFVHYPTDVLAGAVLGILMAWIAARLFTKFDVDRRLRGIGRRNSDAEL